MPLVTMPDGQVVDMPDNLSAGQLAGLQKIQESFLASSAEGEELMHKGKVAGSAALRGLLVLPALAAEAGMAEPRAFDRRPGKVTTGSGSAMADLARLGTQPETPGEKYLAAGIEGVTGALAGPGGSMGSLGKTAVIGGMGGLGSQGAADLIDDNLLTRLLGGLVGGGGAGLAMAAKTNRGALAREALQDTRPQDLALAIERMKTAEAAGIPLNLSQAMPRASNIDAYIDALATSRYGAKTAEMLRRQPEQIAFGVETQMANLPGRIRMPQVLANNAQEVADSAIRQGLQKASTAWQKFAPQGAILPEAVMQNFDQRLGALAKRYPNTAQAELINDVRRNLRVADNAPTGGSPIVGPNGLLLNPPTQGPKYLTDALQVKGAIDDVLQNFGSRKLNTPGLQGKELRRAQEVRAMFRDLIDMEAPALSQANRAYETVMSGLVEPMKKSVVGRIAGRTGAQASLESPQARLFSVFDKGTVPGATSSEILTLEKAFRNAGRPEDFQDAAKSWLAGKVSKALESADNRMPEDIAKRLRTTFGDPRQIDTTSKGFEDIIAGLARSQGITNPQPYVKGVKNFFEIVADAARRPASVRGISAGEVREMASEGLTRRLGQFSIMTPIRQPALRWARFLESDALGAMDKLMTSPEGVEMLIKLGKQPKASHAAVTAVGTFFGTLPTVAGGNTPDVTTP